MIFDMEREHYEINGLVNSSVKTQVKNALEKIDGVNKVCIDIGRGTVEVAYNNPATPETIKNCIESTGHKVQ